MQKLKNHIKNSKTFFLVGFLLFALSPCIVKETLFSFTNIDYAKPLNKAKTTTQTNSCEYSQNANEKTSASKEFKINVEKESIIALETSNLESNSEIKNNTYSKNFSGNSPPKYILYKRLKINTI